MSETEPESGRTEVELKARFTADSQILATPLLNPVVAYDAEDQRASESLPYGEEEREVSREYIEKERKTKEKDTKEKPTKYVEPKTTQTNKQNPKPTNQTKPQPTNQHKTRQPLPPTNNQPPTHHKQPKQPTTTTATTTNNGKKYAATVEDVPEEKEQVSDEERERITKMQSILERIDEDEEEDTERSRADNSTKKTKTQKKNHPNNPKEQTNHHNKQPNTQTNTSPDTDTDNPILFTDDSNPAHRRPMAIDNLLNPTTTIQDGTGMRDPRREGKRNDPPGYDASKRKRVKLFAVAHEFENDTARWDAGFKCVVDNGASVNILDFGLDETYKDEFGELQTDDTEVQLADGSRTKMAGRLTCTFTVKGINGDLSRPTDFCVMNSGGSWNVILGRQGLDAVKAHQSYEENLIRNPNRLRLAGAGEHQQPRPDTHGMGDRRLDSIRSHPRHRVARRRGMEGRDCRSRPDAGTTEEGRTSHQAPLPCVCAEAVRRHTEQDEATRHQSQAWNDSA